MSTGKEVLLLFSPAYCYLSKAEPIPVDFLQMFDIGLVCYYYDANERHLVFKGFHCEHFIMFLYVSSSHDPQKASDGYFKLME